MSHFKFSKMHGNGNDFLVFNALEKPFELSAQTIRALAHRQFGMGADQILVVEPATLADVDFCYRIFNADGGEVEQCGNGARCFTKFIYDKGLSNKPNLRIQTKAGIISPSRLADGRIRINMGAPRLGAEAVGFDTDLLHAKTVQKIEQWLLPSPLDLNQKLALSLVSMGNPHAVLQVESLNDELVASLGAALESHPRFAHRANIGFMHIVSRNEINLRVYERGAGETLACGSGACAAVVAGVAAAQLDSSVAVNTRGGKLTIEWAGSLTDAVFLTGDAHLVFDFDGEINL
jgi:diaminopimelate epimerase